MYQDTSENNEMLYMYHDGNITTEIVNEGWFKKHFSFNDILYIITLLFYRKRLLCDIAVCEKYLILF